MNASDSKTFSAIPSPFARDGDRNIIADYSSDTLVNKKTGIPVIFSTEIDNGGKFIQRKDLNGMAYLLSMFQYYMQVKSVVFFDQSVCDKIGGYPAGAVLAYVDNSANPPEMFFIESNVDNNTDVPVPGQTIDSGTPSDKAWHKLTPSWSDISNMALQVEVVDAVKSNPDPNTYYFIRGEGVNL